MIKLVSSTMMSLLRFTILVVLGGVVTSENHDENSQTPYIEMTKQRNADAKALIPLASATVENRGIEYQLIRLEVLLVEKLENLRTEVRDINTRLQSLEYQSSEVHSTVDNIRDSLGSMSQCSSDSATPLLQSNRNLEAKVESLDKNISVLMDFSRILSFDVETVKQNVSSLITVTRSIVDSSSNLVSKKVFNKGLQELKDLKTATSTFCTFNITPDDQYPKNCKEVQKFNQTTSGKYMIQPEHARKPFEVVCDLETREGGWTVIQKRFDGSQDFCLSWEDYKNGFGNLGGEFWLGLENIHLLTGYEENELLIEVGDFESQNKSEFYSEFSVGSEVLGYPLKVLGDYSGDAGNSFYEVIGKNFTVQDCNHNDFQSNSTTQCLQYYMGGWWYFECGLSNLNGKYFGRDQASGTHLDGIFWYTFKGLTSLKHTRMLVRPKM